MMPAPDQPILFQVATFFLLTAVVFYGPRSSAEEHVYLGASNIAYAIMPPAPAEKLGKMGLASSTAMRSMHEYLTTVDPEFYGTSYPNSSSGGYVPQDISLICYPSLPTKCIRIEVDSTPAPSWVSMALKPRIPNERYMGDDASPIHEPESDVLIELGVSVGITINSPITDDPDAPTSAITLENPVWSPDIRDCLIEQDLNGKWIYCRVGTFSRLADAIEHQLSPKRFKVMVGEPYADHYVYALMHLTGNASVIKNQSQPRPASLSGLNETALKDHRPAKDEP